MKHLFITTMTCMFGAVGVCGQNVEVISKDGLPTRFHTDRVEAITFEPVTSTEPETMVFESLQANPYSNGNVGLSFTKGDITLELDVYGPADKSYLVAGEYEVKSGSAEFTIDPGNYSYLKEGDARKSLGGGKMTVGYSDGTYTVTVDMTDVDGNAIKGSYSGELPNYCPVRKVNISAVQHYDNNNRKPGEFYIKMNDADWNYEIVFDIFASAQDVKLPAGTYSYNETAGVVGSFGPASIITCYRPYLSMKPLGDLTVAYEGENILFSGSFPAEGGVTLELNYSGPITFLDAPEPEPLVFSSLAANPYSNGNVGLTLGNDEISVDLDVYGPSTSLWLKAGDYKVESGCGAFTIDPGSYSYITKGGNRIQLQSGSMKVELNAGVYTINIDLVDKDGNTLKGVATGELPNYCQTKEAVMNAATDYDKDNRLPGEHYIKMNDTNWKYEVAFDIFVEPGSVKIPEGSYAHSETAGVAGTYGPASNITCYGPNMTVHPVEALTVSYDGDDIVIEGQFKGDDDMIFNLSYKGALQLLSEPESSAE